MSTVCRADVGLRGRLRRREPMSRHTSWAIGGPADRFYEPADVDDLATYLRTMAADEPLTWVGLGSNLLVRDGGLEGTVIATARGLGRIERVGETGIRAEVGAPCPKVARFATRHGLGGCEFLAGIPGTMGGALAMNAGAFGGETWSVVVAVETLDRRGCRHRRRPHEYRIGYRTVTGPPGEWFVACELELVADPQGEAADRVRELLRRREETQPLRARSCGSVFRNPPGDYAARLIEACGLKGARVGGAEVSAKHANFIINTGGATAADVEALMSRVVDEVARRHGVELVPEVLVVGRAGAPSERGR
ncbi:MAG: UDP-N-acetylmuramate dehydrogenase [Ectothiorhodospiraceae bacterium]|nr:UDP-N-acetylmuramate dehydrogenase [Chromatiales bacterium]MCP5153927.1 UDP-N-acetylmuramate dehydrogenase [Ectothiorhodospiraceae bacterium]